MYQDPYFGQAIANGFPAVDTFFCLSGLLLSYRLMSNFINGQGFGYYQALIRRFFRLAPTIFVVASFSATLLRYLGFGPRNPLLKEWSLEQCRPNWWKDPLFIDNYVIGENHGYSVNDCLGHCWYTAVEMQLFIILPFILIPLGYNFKAGLSWLGFLTVGSLVIPCLIIVLNDLPPLPFYYLSPHKHFEYLTKYYLVPWCRASPWFVGIWTGIFLVKRPKNIPRFNKIYGITGILIAVIIGMAIVFGIYPYNHYGNHQEMTMWLSAFYATFSRPVWAIAVSWVVVVCHMGYGGIVHYFLSWWAWQPISRLTFCMYLVSPVVQLWWSSTLFVPVYFHYLGKLFEICGVFFISIIVSILLTLTVERPFLNVTKNFASIQGNLSPNESNKHCESVNC